MASNPFKSLKLKIEFLPANPASDVKPSYLLYFQMAQVAVYVLLAAGDTTKIRQLVQKYPEDVSSYGLELI